MKGLIFGCGYLGQRVAMRWRESGADICVVTRSAARADNFNKEGYEAIVADVTRPETLKNLPTADVVLFSVGHDRSAGKPIDEVHAGGMRNVLAALPLKTERIIYISTTGVYALGSGQWVDEDTPTDPQRDGGRASLAAEQVLAAHPLASNSVILRLAGIYGPLRVPFLNELFGGHPIPARESGYLNLIHVDDAAMVVDAAARSPRFENGPEIFCVSDGHPMLRGEYYAELARQLGTAPPRFVEPDPDSPRAARAAANRRVRNTKLLQEFNVKLTYPDYRAGLAAILETQNQ
ncbi:MAG TPA: NAD-dependent epimerase/dehydratase family protein [Lacipirellulaceae bacterium]|nr:NAD-dependent epimerase/dehydratase family protein [Lacipirellulaceae bacterium]